MALTKQKKSELLAKYEDVLKGAKSAVYISFKGVPVFKQDSLRKKLFAEQMNYGVVKKTLWDRAVKSANVQGEAPAVEGEMGVVYGDDLLAPARIAYEFSKTNKSVKILGGVFEGQFKSSAEMMQIATIPPREVLLSQLAYLLKSPMQRIAIAVSEVAKTKN